MVMPIRGLDAGIIPHREFAVRKWFYANPLWYYHRPGTTDELNTNRKFYQLVDPELRDLCKLLNDNGLHTTPSCQGHFYPREHFEQIWEELKREEPAVRGPGLEVKDSETDERYLFRDQGYRLPWSSFEEFYREAGAHQGKGYLGVLAPAELTGLINRLKRDAYHTAHARIVHDPEVGQALGGEVFDIFVEPQDPEHRAREWAAITDYFRTTLRKERVPEEGVPKPDTDDGAKWPEKGWIIEV